MLSLPTTKRTATQQDDEENKKKKKVLMASSTPFNRDDPIDYDLFRTYTNRYRRLGTLRKARIAVATGAASVNKSKKTGSRSHMQLITSVVCRYCPLNHYVMSLYRPLQRTSQLVTAPPPTYEPTTTTTTTEGGATAVSVPSSGSASEPSSSSSASSSFSSFEEESAQKGSSCSSSISSASSSSSSVSVVPPAEKAKKISFRNPFLLKKKKTMAIELGREAEVDTKAVPPSPPTASPPRETKEKYRESVTRLHLERLIVEIAFWESVSASLKSVFDWDRPVKTATTAAAYFYLWHYNMLPASLFFYLGYYLLSYRLDPASFDPIRAAVKARIVDVLETESMMGKLRRGTRLDLLYLHKRFAESYGQTAQSIAESLADFNERGENLILWRDPDATWRAVFVSFSLAILCVCSSPATIWSSILFLTGSLFFGKPGAQLLRSQLGASCSSRMLMFGAPTHAEYHAKLDESW